MDRIELFLTAAPGGGWSSEHLTSLLREWIDRAAPDQPLVDLTAAADREEAVARLRSEGARIVEVRLHREGGPDTRRLTVEASTWVIPSLPSPIWAWAAGIVAGLGALALTLLLLGGWGATLVMGLVGSVILAVLAANLVWRGAVRGRIRDATEASGGQAPATRMLEELDRVLRADARVEQVQAD